MTDKEDGPGEHVDASDPFMPALLVDVWCSTRIDDGKDTGSFPRKVATMTIQEWANGKTFERWGPLAWGEASPHVLYAGGEPGKPRTNE